MIDKAAPTIAIASPATGDSYLLNQPAGASYSCTDGGSGVATCSGTVADGSNIDTASVGSKDFTVNAADNVGNSSTSDDSYSVAYRTQDSASAKHGTLTAVTQLQDYSGRNVSASTVGVTAIDIVNSAGTPVMSLGTAFTFSTKKTHGFAGSTYQVSINVSSLSPGTYSLRYQAGNDPSTHTLTFTR
jgi:hypothetical protein